MSPGTTAAQCRMVACDAAADAYARQRLRWIRRGEGGRQAGAAAPLPGGCRCAEGGTPDPCHRDHPARSGVAGRWRYVSRAIDQFGQVIDVFVSPRRDVKAARRCLERAIGTTQRAPVEVLTDKAAAYPTMLEALLPGAWHRTDRYANNHIECDHGRLKARLGPMRGRKQDRSARVVLAGHALVQNLRRGTTSWRSRRRSPGGWRSRSTSSPW
jgi:DDE domain